MDSKELTKQIAKRYKQLSEKMMDWKSFYTGYLEGYVSQQQEIERLKAYCRYIMEELEDNESVIDTVWVKDHPSCTLFEDIDHTINQPELWTAKAQEEEG